MNEAMQLKPASRVWVVPKRIFAAIVTLLATIGFLANAVGLVSIWVARRPASETVTTLSTFVNNKLGIVHQALARVSARADESKEALARVDNATSKLGDRVDQGNPLLTELASAVHDELGPKIAETRAQAAVLHDGMMSVNAALETLDSLGFITVPRLGDELSTLSDRVDVAQTDLQELRVAIDEARTATSANLVAVVTTRTTKIDDRLARIKSTAIKFQGTVEQKQQQMADFSRTVLLTINLLVLSLTALFLVGAAGQVLLICVSWEYVRSGRFTLLHGVSRE